MRTPALLFLLLLTLPLTACAVPSREQRTAADYGPRPENYQDIVQRHFAPRLLDPYSAMYTFEEPRQTWKSSLLRGTRYGWIVCGTVNAKNRFGGHVGATPFYAIIKDAVVISSDIGVAPSQTSSLTNALAMDAECVRRQ